MLKSFLSTSLRHILKKGWISALNMFCLSLGGAICIFAFSYLIFEMGFDANFNQYPTYRLERHAIALGGPETRDALTPVIWKSAIDKNEALQGIVTQLIPCSEERNAFFKIDNSDPKRQTLHFKNSYFSEPSILEAFPFEWIKKPDLEQSHSAILISESTAVQILETGVAKGLDELVLHMIQNNGLTSPDYRIAGIFKDFPLNSNLPVDVLILAEAHEHLFHSSGVAYTYFRSKQALSHEQQSIINTSIPEGETMYLRPVSSIHFATGVSNNPTPSGNETLLIFLTIIGLIIMLLSVTNYIVSSIFGTIDRMREVGVRKLLGMRPSHLLINFLTESFIIHLFSGILAFAMFQYIAIEGIPFMPDQRTIGSGNPLDFQSISSVSTAQIMLFTLALFFSSTVLSSLYPALYFNRIRPVFLLKGRLQILNSSLLKGANSVVKTLILFQLSSSVLFLSGLMIANQELSKTNQRNAQPYDLQVRGIFPGLAGANETFRQMALSSLKDLQSRELIRDVKYGNLYRDQVQTQGTIEVSLDQESEAITLPLYVVDHTFWKDTIALAAGESFHPEFGMDPVHIILNQKALESLAFTSAHEAINDSLKTNMGKFKIIGVSKDSGKDPVVYVSGFRYKTFLDITLHYDAEINGNQELFEFVRGAEVLLSTAFPKINLLKRDFQKEQLIGQGINVMFLLFSILALAIAAFGLVNLSSFIVEKRGKEIDIRKLLGAQKLNLISIMSSDLLQLVIAASIIAAPIIYLTVHFGLSQYTHSIDLSPLLISIPAIIVLSLSLIIAIPKCWQQANSNLSQSLGRR